MSIVDSEKKRSDEYWMGVRDALRMVDSFIKWARRNENRAKALDDFIHDGLLAAAKRCESCLKDDLGLTFLEGESRSSESPEMEKVPSGYEIGSSLELPSEDEFEAIPDEIPPEPSEVPIESESDSVSIDTVGRLEEEEIEDLSIDGPPREFSSDFELVEPADLDVEPSIADDEVTPTSEPEVEDVDDEDTDHKPSFTWADYEKAVAPTKEDPELVEEDEAVEIPPPVETESIEELSESTSIPEPPVLSDDDLDGGSIDEEDADTTEAPAPITEPPPPPPPPDSDEDEDERRRRARRLFFGD
ncbi:MAG: hypothetical protein ThorAB25_04470 [Candidatus Thorarchaeota archaeon AB_25]|nr:MAG: hypothetical protein ThorAB25_04470 [Candidatus Thorarchaeota archaeon AB_25]